MAAIIETFLICDGNCGVNYGTDNRSHTIAQHRKHAKNEGWLTIDSKDYCPKCRNNGKRSKHAKDMNDITIRAMEDYNTGFPI